MLAQVHSFRPHEDVDERTVDYVLEPAVPLYLQANLDIYAQVAAESHDTVVLSQVDTDNDGQAPVVTSGHAPFVEFGQLQSVIMSENLSTLDNDERAGLANEEHAGDCIDTGIDVLGDKVTFNVGGGEVPALDSLYLGHVPVQTPRQALRHVSSPSLTPASNHGQAPGRSSKLLHRDNTVKVTDIVSNEEIATIIPENVTNDLDDIAMISTLNAGAEAFEAKKQSGVYHASSGGFLADDLLHVQEVQAGGVGHHHVPIGELWASRTITGCRAGKTGQEPVHKEETLLPFHGEPDVPDMLGVAPKQVQKVGRLLDHVVRLPTGDFIDKVLPDPDHLLQVNATFTPDYFVAMHNICAAPGMKGDGTQYDSYTPNHLGARVRLPHTKLNVDRWRHHLVGYENAELCQFLEYGFPLGLTSADELQSKTRNHGSSYAWYGHVDKFITTEVEECGLSGPFEVSPWQDIVVSPLMTAHKKPLSRRCVFDATFGPGSLNDATPSDTYLGQATQYTYPSVEDYRLMVLEAGEGAFMWKRDLSRFYLQLPVDPTEYNKLVIIWRGLLFFFVALAFGLRHSGLQGQRVTDALSWILRRMGLESGDGKFFQVCNYVDDIGGVQAAKARAEEAFLALGELLKDLGLQESVKKAVAPTTEITYLGVQFNSVSMQMSVPPEKLCEIKEEIRRWERKTTITKKELQSLLGKLFWVAKVVRFSRPFMGRLLEQLRSASKIPDKKKMKFSQESKKDIKWWNRYLEVFNGISMIINEDPIPLSYEQLLDKPYDIMAGDATPTGGGAWHGTEYWSDPLPHHLQDPQIPIHVKEFWVLIVAAKLWGDLWTGRAVVLYCDNDSVVETITKRKPRDSVLLSLLREFLFIVVTKKFIPVLRKIDTKKNEIADFLSRRYDEAGAKKIFSKFGLTNMVDVCPGPKLFNFSSDW